MLAVVVGMRRVGASAARIAGGRRAATAGDMTGRHRRVAGMVTGPIMIDGNVTVGANGVGIGKTEPTAVK